jgi:hypothetical protein
MWKPVNYQRRRDMWNVAILGLALYGALDIILHITGVW